MSKFQCLRKLVAELNRLENRLFLANVTMPEKQIGEQFTAQGMNINQPVPTVAQWEHVDIEWGVIFLADSKTGRKPLYLSAAALEVLASLPRIEGNPYIIPGEKAGQPKADLKKPWAAVTKAAGLEGVRIHDLRHSFA